MRRIGEIKRNVLILKLVIINWPSWKYENKLKTLKMGSTYRSISFNMSLNNQIILISFIQVKYTLYCSSIMMEEYLLCQVKKNLIISVWLPFYCTTIWWLQNAIFCPYSLSYWQGLLTNSFILPKIHPILYEIESIFDDSCPYDHLSLLFYLPCTPYSRFDSLCASSHIIIVGNLSFLVSKGSVV